MRGFRLLKNIRVIPRATDTEHGMLGRFGSGSHTREQRERKHTDEIRRRKKIKKNGEDTDKYVGMGLQKFEDLKIRIWPHVTHGTNGTNGTCGTRGAHGTNGVRGTNVTNGTNDARGTCGNNVTNGNV